MDRQDRAGSGRHPRPDAATALPALAPRGRAPRPRPEPITEGRPAGDSAPRGALPADARGGRRHGRGARRRPCCRCSPTTPCSCSSSSPPGVVLSQAAASTSATSWCSRRRRSTRRRGWCRSARMFTLLLWLFLDGATAVELDASDVMIVWGATFALLRRAARRPALARRSRAAERCLVVGPASIDRGRPPEAARRGASTRRSWPRSRSTAPIANAARGVPRARRRHDVHRAIIAPAAARARRR